jgi:hypothetical protein
VFSAISGVAQDRDVGRKFDSSLSERKRKDELK